jgi:hypothetical protein
MSLQDAAWALKRIAELRAEMRVLSPEVRVEMLRALMDGYCRECGREIGERSFCTPCRDIDLD